MCHVTGHVIHIQDQYANAFLHDPNMTFPVILHKAVRLLHPHTSHTPHYTHTTPYTPTHPTLHPTLPHTLHTTPYTPSHYTHYTLHSLTTLHYTLRTLPHTTHTLHPTPPHTTHTTPYTPSQPYTTPYTPSHYTHTTPYTPSHYTHYTLHSLTTLHYTLHSLTLHPLTLHTPHSLCSIVKYAGIRQWSVFPWPALSWVSV